VFFGGLGGAVYAQTITLDFSHSTITGQGFMALAAMIFGKWHPLGAMGAALFFGFAQSLSIVGGDIPFLKDIPSVYLLIAPYVLTILGSCWIYRACRCTKSKWNSLYKGTKIGLAKGSESIGVFCLLESFLIEGRTIFLKSIG
jgi:ABC-type uncharacterized transport system permease subunit